MIYGSPAASLAHGNFGTKGHRTAGAAGERLTGVILNGFAHRAAIFHDLTVPGFQINVDHAVLAGDRLLIVDSKVWQGGRYWSIGGSYFHGLTAQKHPPTRGVAMARESYTSFLRPYGVKVVTPLVALWSGSQASRRAWVNTRGQAVGGLGKNEARPFLHYHYPGAKVIPGNDLHRRIHRFTNHMPAPDPNAVEAIRSLVH